MDVVAGCDPDAGMTEKFGNGINIVRFFVRSGSAGMSHFMRCERSDFWPLSLQISSKNFEMLIGPGVWINRRCAADDIAEASKRTKEFCKFFFEGKGALRIFGGSTNLEPVCFGEGHFALTLDGQIVKVNVIPAQAT